ncbi:hypothetical protein UJ101_00357 [Flavobacteriaceae bacterium UJ101]|nr:hypothetical protein UJ101_00357 [Flavobacteriaceae bacterium UJ101]
MEKIIERDNWFKLLIGFLVISCFVGGYRGYVGITEQSYVLPQWYYYLNIIFNVGALISLLLFFNFKKIGVILFMLFLILDFLVQLFLGDTFNTASLFFIFLSSLLVGVKIIPNWEKYD